MKEIRVFFALFCFILFPVLLNAEQPVSLYNENLHGLSLCNDTEKFLITNGFVPEKTDLIRSGTNEFPCNIKVLIPSAAKNSSGQDGNRQTLILAFTMEDAFRFRNYVSVILDNLKKKQLDYNLILFFSYGDLQSENEDNQLHGTDIFAASIDTPDDYSAVCISFTKKTTAILTPGGAGETTPKWLIKRLSDSFTDSGLQYHLRGGSLGSLYRLRILKADERSSFFLQRGIPCAGVSIPEQADMITYGACTAKFLSSYSSNGTASWDRHYIVFHAGNTLWWTSERFIVICFIVISFSSLFILSELSFIRSKKRAEIKKDVFRLWYILPVIVIISALCFQVSQSFSLFLYHIIGITIFYQFIVKIVITFLINTVIYLLIVKVQGVLEERAYAYLLTVDSVINIFIFSAVDISLFFLFTAEYIIIYIFRPFKKTSMLAAAFLAMMLPYVPYILQITGYADPSVFSSIVYSPFQENVLFSVGYLPFLFQWFRIIARFKEQWNYYKMQESGGRILSAVSFTGAAVVIAVTFFFGIRLIPVYYKSKNSTVQHNKIQVNHAYDSVLTCYSSDRIFFGDTTRTLSIDLGTETERCIISVNGISGNSVIYSDNEYKSDKNKYTDTFLVPIWPPEKITVSYVADISIPSVVTVTAFYPETNSECTMRTYEITIPASMKRIDNKT
jgi:hypothetical protein